MKIGERQKRIDRQSVVFKIYHKAFSGIGFQKKATASIEKVWKWIDWVSEASFGGKWRSPIVDFADSGGASS
jgi:hypothetical protein